MRIYDAKALESGTGCWILTFSVLGPQKVCAKMIRLWMGLGFERKVGCGEWSSPSRIVRLFLNGREKRIGSHKGKSEGLVCRQIHSKLLFRNSKFTWIHWNIWGLSVCLSELGGSLWMEGIKNKWVQNSPEQTWSPRVQRSDGIEERVTEPFNLWRFRFPCGLQSFLQKRNKHLLMEAAYFNRNLENLSTAP